MTARTDPSSDPTATKPLAAFYPLLADLPAFQAAMKARFGKAAPALLRKLRKGKALEPSDPEDVEDFIDEEVHRQATCVHTVEAMAADEWDAFDLMVQQYGPLYFIQACEFDDLGYFGTLEGAIACLEAEWCEAIEARADYLENEEDEN